jgi:hypothetical protein
VSPLERRCRWLLRAYPAWYRRKRSEEMLGTLLEASPRGRNWPSFRDARALVIGGLRVRGRVWWLSILWAGIGAAGAGYFFFVTTKPFTNADFWIPLWNTEPEVISIAAYLAVVAWLVLPIPVLVAGFFQLRGRRPGKWLRAAAWASAWLVGFALMRQAAVWEEYPARYLTYTCGKGGCGLNDYGPAVVSWGELAICAAWLALGAVMTRILAVPAHGWDVPDTSSRPSRKASLWPPGAGDLRP